MLSPKGHKIIDLAKIFGVDGRIIERWFDRWEREGFAFLLKRFGRDAKKRLEGYEDVVYK